jgi:DNA polymerase II
VLDGDVRHSLSTDAYLLSRSWRDGPAGLELELWAVADGHPLRVRLTGQESVMFVGRGLAADAPRRAAVALKSLDGRPVDALYYRTQRELVHARASLRAAGEAPYEADINPVERYLMERFVTAAMRVTGSAEERDGVYHLKNPRIQASHYLPQLSVLSLDIETVGLGGPLLSIAGIFRKRPGAEVERRVFLVRQVGAPVIPRESLEVLTCPDERGTLLEFCRWVNQTDPDLLLGWNVVDFDLDYLLRLARRLGVRLQLGRAGGVLDISEPTRRAQLRSVNLPGRVVLDGIATLRSATVMLESYALDDVSQQLLGERKEIDRSVDAVREIERMAGEDPSALARYNLRDCELVLEIFDRARLIDFVVERQRLTGLALERQGGSVAAFDQLYLPRLHRAGYVAPSVGDRRAGPSSPGGYVMDSVPGLYRNVIVLDFKSLYPSIIRTFLVDPLGLAQPNDDPVPGFDGARFARDGHILPGLIATLWEARDRAKQEGNAAMSQAIKIMMNSFYGVLGTPGCRFFDHRLASSITKRGHEIILLARSYIEERGRDVIYGDTDSLFVLLKGELADEECDGIGRQLARELTTWFRSHLRSTLRIESHLELQFEKHFQRFFMPTMRGSDVGTKKRYVGASWQKDGQLTLVFKGMEAVRTDWTPLARSFQRELFRRIFLGEPYEDYVRSTAAQLVSGQVDGQLVYQKRIRRPIEEYVKNVPPHVQAARKASRVGRRIRYVITVNGPEPAENTQSPLDYDHYLSRQLEPAAQGILHAVGSDFNQLANRQLQLF